VSLTGNGLPLAGSLTMGTTFTATDWTFTAIGGVGAQLTEGAAAARGTRLSVLAAAYLLRIIGDSGGNNGALAWLSWASQPGGP
jgi:putative exporter of polyketide antibiotics